MSSIKITNSNNSKDACSWEKEGLRNRPKIKKALHQPLKSIKLPNTLKKLKNNRLITKGVQTHAPSASNFNFEQFNSIFEQKPVKKSDQTENLEQIYDSKQNDSNLKQQNGYLQNFVKIMLVFFIVSSGTLIFNKVVRPVFQMSSLNQFNQNNNNGNIKEVQAIAIVPKGGVSALGVPWSEVMAHTADRIKWAQNDLNLNFFIEGDCDLNILENQILSADVIVTIQIFDEQIIQLLKNNQQNIKTFLSLDSSDDLQQMTKLGDLKNPYKKQQSQFFKQFFQSEHQKQDQKLFKTVQDFWQRKTSDDILYLFLVLINQYVKEVNLVSGVIRDPDTESLKCMINNCGQEIFFCLINNQCRNALGCLGECPPTDQICAYRCIASFETPQLEQFSLCILQKHNCLKNIAQIQQKPEVNAMKKFRGGDLTHEIAEDIFIGYFGEEKFSWRVVAGKNPAYDYFPCQYQIFYRGQAKNSMWYDPVFKVETIDGRQVWRKRHYRVRRQKTPGKFRFSVLDNGVTSLEDWTIVDCNDELDWCLFYYSGAASKAGISYVGAIFATRSGEWPSMGDDLRINEAFEKCGIKPWELSMVNNQNCVGAPLTPVAIPVM